MIPESAVAITERGFFNFRASGHSRVLWEETVRSVEIFATRTQPWMFHRPLELWLVTGASCILKC